MARKILIVTENGRKYNHDGQLFITNAMKDKYGVPDEIYFCSGPELLRPGVIAKTIEKIGRDEEAKKDLFVAWAKASTETVPGKLHIFADEELINLKKPLTDPKNKGKTAWEIIRDFIENGDAL